MPALLVLMPAASRPVETIAFKAGECTAGACGRSARELAEETAIALTYNRLTHAVMMATPSDLRDFAVGFSLSEEIVPDASCIEDFAVVEAEAGLELRMWIAPAHLAVLERRRRRLAGATGCGMCGLESLAEAMRPVPRVGSGRVFDAAAVQQACASLAAGQALNRATRAVHGAGFWTQEAGLVAVREDVGRHNALDKLGGALALSGAAAQDGIVLLTSRLSIELVQKAARMGACVVAGVSAPTALAVRAAEQAGMTLIGVARADGFELFCGEARLSLPSAGPAAQAFGKMRPGGER
jgi:FdhD protein